MASEQQSAVDLSSGGTGSEMAEEQSKPSFMTKVKAKARKLKSKMKHNGSTEDESPRDASKPRSTDEDENDSEVSESDDDAGNKYDIPYTPLSNAIYPQSKLPAGATAPNTEDSPVGLQTSKQNPYGSEDSTGTEQKSSAVDPTVLKSEGPPGIEQAVPTNYSYFNSDPSKAKLPSEHDTTERHRNLPSAIGGESAEFSDESRNGFPGRDGVLSKSGDKDSELPRSFMGTEDRDVQDRNTGSVQPSQPSTQSLPKSQAIDQDRGVGFPDPSSANIVTPHNSVNDFSNLSGSKPRKQSVSDTSPTSELVTSRKDFSDLSGTKARKQGVSDTSPSSELVTNESDKDTSYTSSQGGAKDADGTGTVERGSWNTPSEESTWTQKAYGLEDSLDNSVGHTGSSDTEARDSAASKLQTNGGEQKSVINRVAETAYGLKDTVASKLGYADQAVSTDSTPVSQKTTDSAARGKEHAASALGFGDQGLSSDEKPVSAKASDVSSEAKDVASQKTVPDDTDKGLANSISDSIMGLPGMLTSKLGLGGGTSSPTSAAATQSGSLKDSAAAPGASTPSSHAVAYDPSARKDTPYPDSQVTTTPGLFDRVSGIASSLFSSGGKQTTTEEDKSSSLENKST